MTADSCYAAGAAMPHSILRSVGAPARKTRRRVDADPLNALAADIAAVVPLLAPAAVVI